MKTSHFLLVASISFAIAFAFSCSSGDEESGIIASSSSAGGQSSGTQSSSSSFDCDNPEYDYDTFEYDGKTYRTVTIGDQIWLADNLNNEEGGKCYNNDPANCEKYGRLYDWATAMDLPESCNSNECASEIQQKHRGICPQGWHIPTGEEWDVLLNTAGGSSVASTHLKATSCWSGDGNGQDTYKFAALPGGYSSNDDFKNIGDYGYWWISQDFSIETALLMYMKYDLERTALFVNPKYFLYSVRCVQD